MPCPALSISGKQQDVRRLIAKYSVRRPLNWFSKRGQVRFRHVTSLPEIEASLPTFFDQHVRRWAKVGKGSLFRDPLQRRFYAALARAGHESGWLFFSSVDVDGEPIAFHFGFDYGHVVTWYKPAFEPDYADHSPGMVLIHQLIEDALRRDRKEIDFTVGDESFKERFANVHRSNVFVSAYRSHMVWWGAVAIREARRTLGKLRRKIRRR
jgi:CelD/BcsL family acetyltransferase involved in cellulose biosynthesis